MADDDLRAVYLEYLACLNSRRWDRLGQFVADGVAHNGERLGLDGYRSMLEADVHAIPDLEFVPRLLLVDGDMVSCMLLFECTPQRTFSGVEPTGRRISFAENVFYRFDGRKIAEVWSLIDMDAVREQMTQDP